MNLTEKEIEEGNAIIAEAMGYICCEKDVWIECEYSYKCCTVYSKTPIVVTQDADGYKQFAELPNPDFGKEKPERWNSDFATLSWGTLNEYLTDLKYHTSWDWLMEAVQVINETHNKNEKGERYVKKDLAYTIRYLLDFGYGFTEYERQWLPMNIINLWGRCVEYFKWKKEQKKQNG